MAQINSLAYLLDTSGPEASPERHADFTTRGESHSSLFNPQNHTNAQRPASGLQTKIFESIRLDNKQIRLTLAIRAQPQTRFDFGNYKEGFEILVVDGDLACDCKPDEVSAITSSYLRIPASNCTSQTFNTVSGCLLLAKLGQMSSTDHELRNTSTSDESLWLPGPVNGTQVFPLHVHDTKNALMIRWTEPAYFKPQLDPLGEELFVVKGSLHDAYGSYEQGSWIRNPVPAWQAWGGDEGTMVYYKNGHFPG